jgi:hypothetical protein
MALSVLFSNTALEASVDHADFEEDQDYESGFAEYFDQEVRPLREDLESRRIEFLHTIRRRFRKTLIWSGPWLALWLGNAIAGYQDIEPCLSILVWFNFEFYLVIMIAPSALMGWWTYFPVMSYKEAVKDEVFTKIVRFYGDDWRYQAKGGFDEEMIRASEILMFL